MDGAEKILEGDWKNCGGGFNLQTRQLLRLCFQLSIFFWKSESIICEKFKLESVKDGGHKFAIFLCVKWNYFLFLVTNPDWSNLLGIEFLEA